MMPDGLVAEFSPPTSERHLDGLRQSVSFEAAGSPSRTPSATEPSIASTATSSGVCAA